MSIQWTLIAGFLYLEIIIVAILVFPILSPRKWSKFFRSRLFSLFQANTGIYFYAVLAILALFLMDAVREMRKYSNATDGGHGHVTAEMKGTIKLFRAQRNMYITGFAIFLAFVIRRVVTMILIQADLLEKAENIVKEAEYAKNLANEVIKASDTTIERRDDSESLDKIKHEMESLKMSMIDIKSELNLEKQKNEELSMMNNNWKLKCIKLENELKQVTHNNSQAT